MKMDEEKEKENLLLCLLPGFLKLCSQNSKVSSPLQQWISALPSSPEKNPLLEAQDSLKTGNKTIPSLFASPACLSSNALQKLSLSKLSKNSPLCSNLKPLKLKTLWKQARKTLPSSHPPLCHKTATKKALLQKDLCSPLSNGKAPWNPFKISSLKNWKGSFPPSHQWKIP